MSRIILIAAVLLVCMYGLFCVWHMKRLTEISKGLIENHTAFHRENPNGTPKIMILGDSTAVGIGANASGSIAAYFGRDFPNADIAVFARSGMRVQELDETFPVVPDGSQDLIVLQIGANDITHFTSLNAFESSLRSVFQKAKRASKNVAALHSGNIGLAPFFPWPVSWIMTLQTRRFRSTYMDIVKEEGIAYVNLYKSSRDDILKGSSEYYAPDYLHLTAKGYEVWYNEVRSTMASEGIVLP